MLSLSNIIIYHSTLLKQFGITQGKSVYFTEQDICTNSIAYLCSNKKHCAFINCPCFICTLQWYTSLVSFICSFCFPLNSSEVPHVLSFCMIKASDQWANRGTDILMKMDQGPAADQCHIITHIPLPIMSTILNNVLNWTPCLFLAKALLK